MGRVRENVKRRIVKKAKKKNLKKVHTWKGPIEGYSMNFWRANMWKVDPYLFEIEDLMQESFIIFLKCQRRYLEVSDRHFMSLYKTALERRCIDLSRQKKEAALSLDQEYQDAGNLLDTIVGDVQIEEDRLIEDAPSEIREVLTILLKSPSEVLWEVTEAWKQVIGGSKPRYNGKFFSWILGISASSDIEAQIKEYLS